MKASPAQIESYLETTIENAVIPSQVNYATRKGIVDELTRVVTERLSGSGSAVFNVTKVGPQAVEEMKKRIVPNLNYLPERNVPTPNYNIQPPVGATGNTNGTANLSGEMVEGDTSWMDAISGAFKSGIEAIMSEGAPGDQSPLPENIYKAPTQERPPLKIEIPLGN
jgi:hypothetical protein